MSLGPVTLQVMLGALRAACEEMGAVLVRSAHSANIKERRDASTALFDAEGEMVMQAEHIPVHLGAMPAAVAAVLGESHEPGRRLDPQRPVPRRHPPARHHGDLAALPRRRADRLRRQPRPPRRRGRAGAGQHARGLAHARGRGGGDPAHPAHGRRAARPRRAHAQPAPARGRPPRPARRRARGRRARGGAGGALRARHPARPASRRRRTTPSGAPAPGSPSSTTGPARPGTCSRPPTATWSCGCAPRSTGDEMTLDFEGTAAQHDGNLNCPLAVTLSACYFAAAGAHRPRRARPASGAYRPLTVSAPEGSLLNARPPGRGGRGQRGDLVARRRPRAGRLRARARPGHDEQPHARQRRLHLLRDARRRPGRVPGRRRPERRARGDVATRSTRRSRRSSWSSRCGPWSTRCGAAPAAPGAHRGGDGVVRELEALAPMRYSLITERRRHLPPGAEGGEPGAPGRNLLNGEELPAKCVGRAAPRRPTANRDPRRWRTWRRAAEWQEAGAGGWPSSASGSWASRWPPTCARAGFDAGRVDPHRREGRALRGRARRARRGHAGRGRARAPTRSITMVVDAPEVEEVLLGDDGAARALRGGALCVDMSTIAPTRRAADRRAAGASAACVRGRAGHRLAAQGRGRHAHDHGRGAEDETSSARDRCSRPWAGSWCTWAPRVTAR